MFRQAGSSSKNVRRDNLAVHVEWCETLPRPEDLPGTLRVYSRFGRVVSIVSYENGKVYKRAKNFGGIEEALGACDAWNSLGFSGNPSSPSGFFREAWLTWGPRQKMRQVASVPGVRGGWCETFKLPGPHRSGLKEYDLNKAYLSSALSEGFPQWVRFTERPTKKTFMLWVKLKSCHLEARVEPFFPEPPALPRFLRLKEGREVFITPEQWEIWGPLDAEILGCFEAVKRSNEAIPYVMEKLEGKIPDWTWCKLLSSFWGAWLPTHGLADETWRGGERVSYRRMGSDTRVCNAPWAERIVDNVIVRIFHDIRNRDPVLVHVDNVVSAKGGYEVSEKVGDWKVKRDLPEGIYLEASGVWHNDPASALVVDRSKWLKHAGYPAVRELHDKLTQSEILALARSARTR